MNNETDARHLLNVWESMISESNGWEDYEGDESEFKDDTTVKAKEDFIQQYGQWNNLIQAIFDVFDKNVQKLQSRPRDILKFIPKDLKPGVKNYINANTEGFKFFANFSKPHIDIRKDPYRKSNEEDGENDNSNIILLVKYGKEPEKVQDDPFLRVVSKEDSKKIYDIISRYIAQVSAPQIYGQDLLKNAYQEHPEDEILEKMNYLRIEDYPQLNMWNIFPTVNPPKSPLFKTIITDF